jgi:16S rRNA (cytosine967-C5)-methyltransferase
MTGTGRSGKKRGSPGKGVPSVTENRKAAASVLWAVSRGRRLDRALDEATEKLSSRDRRWVQEAAYGTTRLRGRLDFLLELHLSKGTSSLYPRVLDLLRLGAYQLLQMGGVPSYAAISQTVDQVKEEMGAGGGRLANGVLRSLGREGGGEERFPSLQEDPMGHLTSWGSHPDWMVARWLERWGAEGTQALVAANNATPHLFFRPLGADASETPERMAEAGLSFQPAEDGAPCFRLEDGTNPARLLEDFTGIVQDPGAALVTVYADPPPGVTVVDLCSAPGGKTMALAGEDRRVLAGDRSFARLRLVGENRDRLGGDVMMFVADARHPPLSGSPFVLLDVPCSGTGTLRRHPDARWRLTLDMLKGLVELQREMLDSCGKTIPPGGHLVYSTCTLEEEENEDQVASFLAKNPGFRIEETSTVSPSFLTREGYLRVLPQEGDFDGAFAARMVRVS